LSGGDHNIIGALVSPAGFVLGNYVNIDDSANDDRVPRVAFDGMNYLVVYERAVSSSNHNIIGARVSPAGTVLGGSPFAIDDSPNDDINPSVAFDGMNYLVVYEEVSGPTDHDIIGARVSPAGTVLGGSPFAIDDSPNDGRDPAITFGGGNYLVVYQEDVTVTTTDHNIRGTLVDPTGTVSPGSPFNIDFTTNDDIVPAVASDGTNFLVAYQRIFSTDSDIRGATVNATGSTITPFAIDTLVDVDDVAPAVAFDGTNYLVAYQENTSPANRNIIGTRVSPAGVANTNAVLIDTSGFDDLAPAVAFGATSYLVAYEEVFSSTDHDIIGALVTP
jgi:hypothetical protein